MSVDGLERYHPREQEPHWQKIWAERQSFRVADDPDKPVYVTAFVSEEVPEVFVQQRNLLLNLVDQFDSIGGNAVQKSIVIPEPYSPEARAAEDNYGIRAQTVPMELPGGGYAEKQVFLAFVAAYAVLRFLLEVVRADDRGGLFRLSTSQLIGAGLVAAALAAHRRLGARADAAAAGAAA